MAGSGKILVFALACYFMKPVSAGVPSDQEKNVCNGTVWKSYKVQYGKDYPNSSRLNEQQRQEIFCDNLRKIARHNANPYKTFTMGVNHFSDKSEEEMAQMFANNVARSPVQFMKALSPRDLAKIINVNEEPPAELDWSKDPRRVSSARYQGDCGSCWAHSTVAMLEGQEKPGPSERLVELSEQNLIDCDQLDRGCQGGEVYTALTEIRRFGGLMSLSDYPYVSGDTNRAGTCQIEQSKTYKTTRNLDEPKWLKQGNETLLMQVVASYGPVAVSIRANEDFQFYRGGIYYSRECDKQVNHGVVIVGYGSSDGMDYWKIKNSWSKMWGTNGFGLMARNKNDHCRITTQAFLAISRDDPSGGDDDDDGGCGRINGNVTYNDDSGNRRKSLIETKLLVYSGAFVLLIVWFLCKSLYKALCHNRGISNY